MVWEPLIGERSERAVAYPGTTLTARDGYDVVRTPERPDYHTGNVLVLHEVPAPRDLGRWRLVWQRELGTVPGVDRLLLSWEQAAPEPPAGMAEAAAAAGMELSVDDVLVLGDLTPREPRVPVLVRPVLPAEWAAVPDFYADHDGPDVTAGFRHWQLNAHLPMIAAGSGRWWGAWRDGLLVGAAGLFAGDGLARYRSVVVRTGHRGGGIASALAGTMAADHLTGPHAADPLVIVAERGSQAARIYRRLGFAHTTTFCTLNGPPPD